MSVDPLPQVTTERKDAMESGGVDEERRQLDLVTLLDELLNSALLTAATASIGNAIMSRKHGTSRRMISAYLPPTPSFFHGMRLLLSREPGMLQLSRRLGDYYANLQTLRELTARDAMEPDTLEVSIASLTDAWRQLAQAAENAIGTLADLLYPELKHQTNERRDLVLELLAQVSAGNSPCIDAYGTIRLPIWANRRSGQRVPKDLQAYFLVNESLQRAAVLDVSEIGIGVLGLRGASSGSRVTLLLGPGHSSTGRVIWVKATRCGIELDEPLPPDCQLLACLH